jgi:hypothetical protein
MKTKGKMLFDPRDILMAFKAKEYKDGMISVRISVLDETNFPTTKKCVRGEMFIGNILLPVSENKSKLIGLRYMNPGGSIPNMMINK